MARIRSFGDGLGDDDEQQVQQPPAGIPRITLVLEPALDDQALAEQMRRVREAVAQAVRDGFRDAMGDGFGAAGSADGADGQPGYDANPAVNGNDPFAYAKYAERLDKECPGWWRDSPAEMAPELAEQARRRRERERARGTGASASR